MPAKFSLRFATIYGFTRSGVCVSLLALFVAPKMLTCILLHFQFPPFLEISPSLRDDFTTQEGFFSLASIREYDED